MEGDLICPYLASGGCKIHESYSFNLVNPSHLDVIVFDEDELGYYCTALLQDSQVANKKRKDLIHPANHFPECSHIRQLNLLDGLYRVGDSED